jgi:hypothetical protein
MSPPGRFAGLSLTLICDPAIVSLGGDSVSIHSSYLEQEPFSPCRITIPVVVSLAMHTTWLM